MLIQSKITIVEDKSIVEIVKAEIAKTDEDEAKKIENLWKSGSKDEKNNGK